MSGQKSGNDELQSNGRTQTQLHGGGCTNKTAGALQQYLQDIAVALAVVAVACSGSCLVVFVDLWICGFD